MKRSKLWIYVISLVFGAGIMVSCSDDDNNNPTPSPQYEAQVGTYVWGSTIYDMGTDGASRLAEAYEQAGIKHVVLLVKGEAGKVGYNSSIAPKVRTDRDILQETVTAMHARDIKVYAWLMVCKDAAWLVDHPTTASYHFRRGYVDNIVDPTNAEYREYLGKIVKEIDQNYAVDGFAFDGLRYMGAYFGWSDSDYERLTASTSQGGYGITLAQYNELVTLMAREFGYPTSADATGRLVYDANATAPAAEGGVLFDAYTSEHPGVYAFGKMRENIIDDFCEQMVELTSKPTYIALMPEASSGPTYATLSYGQTYNQAYTFDVVCPMLYAADYGKDATWVTSNINYIKNLGYSKILASLQAYRSADTESLAADVKAATDAACTGYLLFRTGTYDMARPVKNNDGSITLTYVRGTDSTCGNLTITLSGATPASVAMGGKLAQTSYTINGQTITLAADALTKLGEYGTLQISLSNISNPAVKVESDERIVYNAPMNY